MIRIINQSTFLFLCQSSDWQCIIESEDEETAATLAIENIMLNKNDDDLKNSDNMNIGMLVAVKKLNNNLFDPAIENETKLFYSPIILANAGFYNEAKNLDEILNKLQNEDEENEI